MIHCGDELTIRGLSFRVAIVAVTFRWVALIPSELWPEWPLGRLLCAPLDAIDGREVDPARAVVWEKRPRWWHYETFNE